ncbi:MAG TPA: hypothetical protein VHO70_13860 [Chitinispirillaceae bacterium]|nr:hypothetical protein [Chitinispirillaceae bacterium]
MLHLSILLSPQIPVSPVRHVCVTWDSSINAREIYASTDSGIYIFSPRVNSGKWQATTRLKSYGIVSFNPSNTKTVYAATETGLWKYVSSGSVSVRKVTPVPVFKKETSVLYTIDGKKLSVKSTTIRYNGVYITVQSGVSKSHQIFLSQRY